MKMFLVLSIFWLVGFFCFGILLAADINHALIISVGSYVFPLGGMCCCGIISFYK